MGNLHRIQWIDRRIRALQYPNCNAVAAQFEISRRQAARDMEYLRDSLGAPLAYSPLHNGYFYEDDAFRLPGPALTAEDEDTLRYLSSQLTRSGGGQAARMAALFAALASSQALPGQPLPSRGIGTEEREPVALPAIDAPESVLYRRIDQALLLRRKVEIDYVDGASRPTRRIIHPYLLFRRAGTDYLAARCELRASVRTFALPRIRRLEMLRQGYAIPDSFDPERYRHAAADRTIPDLLPHTARVRFTGNAMPNRYPLAWRHEADGCLALDFLRSADLLSWLLGHPPKFEVLSPAWLRSALKERLHRLLACHGEEGAAEAFPSVAETGEKNITPAKQAGRYDTPCHTPGVILETEPTPDGPESGNRIRHRTGGKTMAKRKLENTTLGMTWTTWAAAAVGVLRGAGLYQDELWQFMGSSGIAFHFIVHKGCCPSSVTVYDWTREHLEMLDRIGIASDVLGIDNHLALNTAEPLRQAAVDRIRRSIDDGIGVIAWAPTPLLEFGIITGYDDEDGVFFVEACGGEGPADPLRYGNLGRSEVPMLSFQFPLARIDVPEEKTIRSSLAFGVSEWNKPFHIAPDYASGRKGFDNLIGALRGGEINPMGLGYILAVYHDARVNLARYLDWVNTRPVFAGKLDAAVAGFRKTRDLFGEMARIAPFDPTGASFQPATRPQLAALAEEAKSLEETAIAEIAKVIG